MQNSPAYMSSLHSSHLSHLYTHLEGRVAGEQLGVLAVSCKSMYGIRERKMRAM